MRPAGPVPLTALRSTPWAAATRAATGVTLAPSGTATCRRRRRGAARRSAPAPAWRRPWARPAPAVMRASTWPTVTVSPASARISVIVPLAGAGISASTLSVEISTIVSSTSTLSPTALAHSRIVPSETDSPICGHRDVERLGLALRLGGAPPRPAPRRRASPRRARRRWSARSRRGWRRRRRCRPRRSGSSRRCRRWGRGPRRRPCRSRSRRASRPRRSCRPPACATPGWCRRRPTHPSPAWPLPPSC